MPARTANKDSLEYLLVAMNDERFTRMQRDRIARRIAPYFHPKLKPVPPEACEFNFASTSEEDLTEDDVERMTAERERFRGMLFKDFD